MKPLCTTLALVLAALVAPMALAQNLVAKSGSWSILSEGENCWAIPQGSEEFGFFMYVAFNRSSGTELSFGGASGAFDVAEQGFFSVGAMTEPLLIHEGAAWLEDATKEYEAFKALLENDTASLSVSKGERTMKDEFRIDGFAQAIEKSLLVCEYAEDVLDLLPNPSGPATGSVRAENLRSCNPNDIGDQIKRITDEGERLKAGGGLRHVNMITVQVMDASIRIYTQAMNQCNVDRAAYQNAINQLVAVRDQAQANVNATTQ